MGRGDPTGGGYLQMVDNDSFSPNRLLVPGQQQAAGLMSSPVHVQMYLSETYRLLRNNRCFGILVLQITSAST